MRAPVIISCALTGGADTTRKSQYVPVTPKQIAEQALEAADAGASIAHIHVRNPETGHPSVSIDLYAEVMERIRSANNDLIINLTTGPGALFQSRQEEKAAFEPYPFANPAMSPRERVEHIIRLRPDICSLDVATMNFGPIAMINTPAHLIEMAQYIEKANVKPEIKIFDLGHLQLAKSMIANNSLRSPSLFQFCLGISWGAPAMPEVISLMRSLLPSDAIWSAFAVSHDQFPIVAATAMMGGHVRVGLEDNLYLERGTLAPSNAALVKKAREIVNSLGYGIASPSDARRILSLPR